MTVKKGVDNLKNRLTEEDVLVIYNDQDNTQQALATRYGVHQSTINHIQKGRTWGWLTQHAQ